jgi:uncharacterized membrane protein
MFCQKCGCQNSDNAQFCVECGAQTGVGASPGSNPQDANQNMGYNPYSVPNPNAGSGAGTQSGLQKNVAGLLCYVLGWVTGIIFYVIEKDRFVRFHAMQSIFTFGALTVIRIILSILISIGLWRILFLAALLNMLLGLATFAVWILLMVKAYQGKLYKLPIVGDMAEKYAK